MVVVNLLSGTDYSVKVMATYSNGASEALSGRGHTCESGSWGSWGGDGGQSLRESETLCVCVQCTWV